MVGITWRLSFRRRWVTSVETRGGRVSRQRSNCTSTLVKWSEWGDLLEVKSETTAIGGVVSSIEQFSVRWTPVRESSEVNERLQIATSCSTAGLPSFLPFMACRTVLLTYYYYYYYCYSLVLLCIFIFADLCSFIKLSFLYFPYYITPTTRHLNHSWGTSFRRLKRSMVAIRSTIQAVLHEWETVYILCQTTQYLYNHRTPHTRLKLWRHDFAHILNSRILKVPEFTTV